MLGLSCSTSTVRYAAPSAPASSEFVSIRRNRITRSVYFGLCPATSTPRAIRTRGCPTTTAWSRSTRPRSRRLARPGQFVMVKPVARHPIRCCGGRSRSSKSCATRAATRPGSRSSTSASASARVSLYDAEPGTRVACLGPLGRPFEPVDPPARGLDGRGRRRARAVRHARRSARCARGTPTTLFYGARRARELYYVGVCSSDSASASCSRPKTAAAARRDSSPDRSTMRSPPSARSRPSSSMSAGRRR